MWATVSCPECGGRTRCLRTFAGLAVKREKRCLVCGLESTTWELNEKELESGMLEKMTAALHQVSRKADKEARQRASIRRARVLMTDKKENRG